MSDADRRAHLRFLQDHGVRHGFAIWAYCLMTHHGHLVAAPQREESLPRAYTMYVMPFHTCTQQSGHVLQGRFYSCPLDEEYLWSAVRYVERNPLRIGLGDARGEQLP